MAMGNLDSKEKSWQWRKILIIFIATATSILLAITAIYYWCGRSKIGWIELSDLATLILNALVVIGLGLILADMQKKSAEDIADGQDKLAKDIERRQANLAEDIAKKQIKHDVEIAGQQKYSISIDYLSSSNPAVRLKGVRALYNYAKDVQELPVGEAIQVKKEVWNLLNNHVRYYTQDTNYQERFPEKPSADIQEIVDIQGRREGYKESNVFLDIELGLRVEWVRAWLRGANLMAAQLQEADLRRVQLRNANLQIAHLQYADLQGAHLQLTDLTSTHLQRANLSGAQLQRAYLCETLLQEAHLGNAQLQVASLIQAHLQGVRLGQAQLQRAELFASRLQGADLQEAQLQGARLQEVQLQGANMRGSQLQEANLKEAQLQGAYGSERFMHLQDKGRVDKNTDASSAVLERGLKKEDIENIRNQMNLNEDFWDDDWDKEELEKLLNTLTEKHTGKAVKASNEKLEFAGAVPGKYSEEEADQWIKELYVTTTSLDTTLPSVMAEMAKPARWWWPHDNSVDNQ